MWIRSRQYPYQTMTRAPWKNRRRKLSWDLGRLQLLVCQFQDQRHRRRSLETLFRGQRHCTRKIISRFEGGGIIWLWRLWCFWFPSMHDGHQWQFSRLVQQRSGNTMASMNYVETLKKNYFAFHRALDFRRKIAVYFRKSISTWWWFSLLET